MKNVKRPAKPAVMAVLILSSLLLMTLEAASALLRTATSSSAPLVVSTQARPANSSTVVERQAMVANPRQQELVSGSK